MQRFVYIGVLVLASLGAAAQIAATTLTVHAGNYARQNTLVCAQLTDSLPSDGTVQLHELAEGQRRIVISQVEGRSLCWTLAGTTPAGTNREYELSIGPPATSVAPAAAAKSSDGKVTFTDGGKTLLSYQIDKAPVPPGADPIYSRGGFIHPLLSPAGDTLTRIQPSDHYHHYGVWNPWVHAEHDGRELDFWNLVKGQGTVAVEGVGELIEGPLQSSMTARQRYLAFRDSAVMDHPQKLLDETLRLRVQPLGDDRYLVDYQTTQTNPTELPFTVRAYRYQGFGYRARAGWDDSNVTLNTSAGYDKHDGNGTRARWMNVSGPVEHGRAGILFMSHPENYNFPEQIRIWPTGMNEGRENVFVNFNPAQEQDYVLRPGGSYQLHYGMLVYDGTIDSTEAERYWQDFAHPPEVVVQNNDLAGTQVLVYTRNGEGYVHDNIASQRSSN